MTPRTARWSPYQLIVDGHFARPDDLTDAAKTLSRAHGGAPIIVATFSAYYLLPSLSRICGVEQVHDAGQALEGLRQELETTLRSGGPAAVIRSCAKVFLEYCGQLATTKLFGAGLDRPGDLMVAISCPASAAGLLESDGARYVVTSALGSRNAAFHRENALDLSVARRVKEASSSVEHEQAPGADDELNAIASSVLDLQTENLIALALRTLPAEAIVTYDVDGTDLRLRYRVGEVAASLRPDRRPVDPESTGSRAATFGGPALQSLAELADLCASTDRRVVGVLATGQSCIGFPFGAEHVGASPVGAICLVLKGSVDECFGSYEQSLMRLLATHFARAYGEHRWAAAVRLVTTRLREISGLGMLDPEGESADCASELDGREDIELASPIVMEVLDDIAKLSGAMSVTCWIIAGSAGPLFCRGLFRFHGVGVDRSELDRSVPLDDSDSVNAWVAINGRAVYLRSIVPAGSDGVPASPDLGRYPGLERVSVVRSSVHAVLCVPVFAEDKLVGTINLEAATPFAFDLTADVVEECAQLIGVALLEARRQISVRTMTQARGFLSRRHELEHRLVNFGTELKKWLKDVPLAAEKAADRIEELKRFVYLRNAVPVKHAGTAVSVNAVLRQATAAIEWTYKTVQPAKFAYNKDMMEFIELSSVEMSDDAAEALLFAVTQTLLNVRKYGSKASELADWEFPVQYALSLSRLGGRETLYLAIRSVCKERDIADLQPNRVFREPIEHRSGRTSLGAFLAGEVLRRCGGSAYFRVDVPESDGGILRFVTAELGVPTLG